MFFATTNFLFTKIQGDITNIVWNYKNQEVFSLSSGKVLLEATPILANHQEDVNADLNWTVENINLNEEKHAEIENFDDDAYLKLLSVGDIKVSCTNNSGNISKSFRAKIFTDGALVINTTLPRSFNAIGPNDNYGIYDFNGDEVVNASFKLDITAEPYDVMNMMTLSFSDNIRFSAQTGIVEILRPGPAYVSFDSSMPEVVPGDSYTFDVIENGYNVYSYQDLLNCTNKSDKGRIVCLQTNLETLKNTYQTDSTGKVILDEEGKPTKLSADVDLFGTYDFKTNKFNFSNEVYRFASTYNTKYIDEYNAQTAVESEKIKDQLVAGLRIQKDFYGNGFIINAHALCYPTGEINTGENLATLGKDDLFRGPLPFIIIGNNQSPIVKAYGQDNVGFYIDKDNVTLNGVYFKNCDFSNILQNNDTTGTVLEVNGNNVSIINSHLSSGRTILRAFSTENLLVKNSLLEKGREFIAKIGSNEYEKIDLSSMVTFSFMGKNYEMSKEQFFTTGQDGISAATISEQLLKYGISSSQFSYDDLVYGAQVLQEALNQEDKVKDQNGNLIYKGSVTFEDTFFYQSGLFSLGIDSMFNGPYLYDGNPVKEELNVILSGVLYPSNVGGVSYPTKTVLKGDTRFYDYKTLAQTDTNCLVYQNVSDLNGGTMIDLDSFFPIKKLFLEEAEKKKYVASLGDEKYLSAAIVKYGGGSNLSTIDYQELTSKAEFGDKVILDTFDASLKARPASSGFNDLLIFMIGRCVPMALGFSPFEVMMYNGSSPSGAYLFQEQVSLDILKNRA